MRNIAKVAANDAESRKDKLEQAVHHRKYRKVLNEMQNDHCDSKLSGCRYIFSDFSRFTSSYYISHINTFNYVILMASRGSNQIASSIFNLVNQGKNCRDKLTIWSDNC
ncbi:hypothetical protein PR048_029844 [Dryococelus australis]|uniref:Uncharacterized protein n=1 Tax=Dryococelus australis TaxID=614101 RepID=A0ABQ9G790_9NEOP|nr:hypothetical protein PR048_029844 [Dryococelus australis]